MCLISKFNSNIRCIEMEVIFIWQFITLSLIVTLDVLKSIQICICCVVAESLIVTLDVLKSTLGELGYFWENV